MFVFYLLLLTIFSNFKLNNNTFFFLGFKVEAASFIDKFKRTPTLGECTLGTHIYTGEKINTPFSQLRYKYSQKSGSLHTLRYTDVLGGVGVSAFGLFGASVKARVISKVKRDSKSLTIYSHLVIHKAMSSLSNPEIGSNWQSCSKLKKHYYLRDILTGMEDYLMVQLKFKSESKRKEVEVKMKVKLLFFSITKTIRRIKTSLSSDFSVSVYRVRTFPSRSEEEIKFLNVDSGTRHIESIEKGRLQLLKDIRAAKNDDLRLHLEYFFMPCMIKTIIDGLPFKPASSFVIIELIERTNEMKSVLQDIDSIKAEATENVKSELERLEQDIKQRLKQIGDWKKKQLSRGYVTTLLELYGPGRAPYYYERKLNRILNN